MAFELLFKSDLAFGSIGQNRKQSNMSTGTKVFIDQVTTKYGVPVGDACRARLGNSETISADKGLSVLGEALEERQAYRPPSPTTAAFTSRPVEGTLDITKREAP